MQPKFQFPANARIISDAPSVPIFFRWSDEHHWRIIAYSDQPQKTIEALRKTFEQDRARYDMAYYPLFALEEPKF